MNHDVGLHGTLRALRRERGLTLGQLAGRAGTSQGSVQGWETGRRVPKGPALERLLNALEAPARLRTRLLAEVDPQHARFALVDTPLGPPIGLGMVLRAMRESRGVTQAELARRVGVSQGTVAKWESGDSTPSTETLHSVGFALGAAVEEALALASARGEDPGGLPDEPGWFGYGIEDLPSRLREMVFLSFESELWRRAARDERWEPQLCRVIAYRANQYVLDGRFAEIPALAGRALRLATTLESRIEAVPAVSALGAVSDHRGESPVAAAEAAQAWGERMPDSMMKAWMMRTQGMALARMGRAEEGIALVARSRDMDERDEKYLGMGSRHALVQRAESMTEVFLAARRPQEAYETAAGCREADFGQVIYARAHLATGRPLLEAEMAFLRLHMRQAWKRTWKDLSRLERIERGQARLTGQAPCPVSFEIEVTAPHEGEMRRLWESIPGARPFAW